MTCTRKSSICLKNKQIQIFLLSFYFVLEMVERSAMLFIALLDCHWSEQLQYSDKTVTTVLTDETVQNDSYLNRYVCLECWSYPPVSRSRRVLGMVGFLAFNHMTQFRFWVLSSISVQLIPDSKRTECGPVQKEPGPHSHPCRNRKSGSDKHVHVGMVSPQTHENSKHPKGTPFVPIFSYLNLLTFHTISNMGLKSFFFFDPF